MTSLRRSALDVKFLTIKEWADVPLDMNPPQVAFTVTGAPSVWYATDWVGNSTFDTATGLNYRSHRILIGPDAQAALALTPGRWLVWRQLTDNPEIPLDLVAGTITIF